MCDNMLMPRRPYKLPLQRRIIDKMIFLAATLQPLANVPQIIAIYSHHSAHDVSISSWIIFVAFDWLWLWYGLAEKQKAIIVSATLFIALESTIIIGAVTYGGTW